MIYIYENNSYKLLLIWGIFALVLLVACHPSKPLVQVGEVQLSPPSIQTENVFFYESTQVTAIPPPANCSIYYTTDGSSPNEKSLVIEEVLTITASTTVTCKTLGGGFLPSEEKRVDLFKIHPKRLSVVRITTATPPYDQAAPTILTDHRKATKNFRSGEWLGFQDSVVTLELDLTGASVRGVVLSFLEDQGSWIFGPVTAKASFYDAAGTLLIEVQNSYAADLQKEGNSFQFLHLTTTEISPASMKLEIKTLEGIPEWHPGSGTPTWLFLDEVIVL